MGPAAAKLLQSFPTLCNTIDGSPLGSSVSGRPDKQLEEGVGVGWGCRAGLPSSPGCVLSQWQDAPQWGSISRSPWQRSEGNAIQTCGLDGL